MFGGAFGIWQWLIVLAIVLLLFGGRGKISGLMGDFGKGLRNFKTGVKGEGEDEAEDDDEAEMIAEEKPARPVKKTRAATTKKASTTRSDRKSVV